MDNDRVFYDTRNETDCKNDRRRHAQSRENRCIPVTADMVWTAAACGSKANEEVHSCRSPTTASEGTRLSVALTIYICSAARPMETISTTGLSPNAKFCRCKNHPLNPFPRDRHRSAAEPLRPVIEAIEARRCGSCSVNYHA